MVRMTAKYVGEKHCEAIHEPSKSIIETDAPKDNQGRGEKFSPTDLVGTALATCMLTTIAIVAERDGIDIKNSTISVEKEMASDPRRIANLKITFHLPKSFSEEMKRKLEFVANTCPVKKSLHPDLQTPIEFKYDL